MISIFAGDLPDVFSIDGTDYTFHSDFREWLRFEQLMLDPDIPQGEKPELALKLIFPNCPPMSADVNQFMLWFYRCGKSAPHISKGKKDKKSTGQMYSFEYDDLYIYAAFRELYGMDLSEVSYLHWWKFKALFQGLHDCKFTDIIGYRSAEINSKTPAERKRFLESMKELYKLPRSISEEQKIREAKAIMESLNTKTTF